MITITCPNNNSEERNYIISFFMDYLGCEYIIKFAPNEDATTLLFDNGKTIIVEDHFFNKYPIPLSYIHKEALPSSVSMTVFLGSSYPIIYGRDFCSQDKEVVRIGIDIFASAFFLLARWEEFLLGREINGDCDENELWAIKNEVYDRPIVNEYLSLLCVIMQLFGVHYQLRHKYKVVLSHDVDGITPITARNTWHDFQKGIKSKGLLSKLKAFRFFANHFYYLTNYCDSRNMFRRFHKLTAGKNIPQFFYFKCVQEGETGFTYDINSTSCKKALTYVRTIPYSLVCFHPSENSLNKGVFEKEFDRYHEFSKQSGRNHHLLWTYDIVRNWCSHGVLALSNVGFHHHNGFRAGVVFPFQIFDIFKRKRLGIVEHPFIMMDVAFDLATLPMSEIRVSSQRLIETVRRYHGELMLSWHIFYSLSPKLLKKSISILQFILENS